MKNKFNLKLIPFLSIGIILFSKSIMGPSDASTYLILVSILALINVISIIYLIKNDTGNTIKYVGLGVALLLTAVLFYLQFNYLKK